MSISHNPDQSDVVGKSYVSKRISVSTTEVEAKVGGAALADRQELILFNDSAVTIYVGPTGVTSSGDNKGLPIDENETINMQVGDGIGVFMITASGSASIIVQELS